MELAKAYVQIIPSAKGIKGKISEVMGGEASSAGNSSGQTLGSTLASVAKKVIAAAGIGAAIKSSLSEGADLQQSIGGIETIFKDSADTVKEYAKNAYKTAGLSANDYMESVTGFSASLLQGLGGDTGKAAEIANTALTDMSDNANKMGTNMQDIQNAYQGFAKQNYTMLDNLKLGYGGTQSEMIRLINDSGVLNEKITSLDGVTFDQMIMAIHKVQDNLDITGTTAKEAATTFSGSLASMQAAGKNLLANLSLGEDIGPSLQALAETVNTFVVNNLLPMVGNILSQLPSMLNFAFSSAVSGLDMISDNAEFLVNQGLELISELITGIISNIPYLLEAAVNVVVAFGQALLNADWVGIATNLINTLRQNMDTAAGDILGTDGNLIGSVLNAITTHLPEVLQKGCDIIVSLATGFLQNLPVLIENVGNMISQFIGFIMDKLPTIRKTGMDLLLKLAEGIIDNLPQIISSALKVVLQIEATILEHLPDILETGIELIAELAIGIVKAIPKILATIPQIFSSFGSAILDIDWGSIGLNIIKGIVKGLLGAGSMIVDAAKEAASSALKAAKNALGIHSPSRVFETEVGKMIDLGLAAGIDNNVSPVQNSMRDLSDQTIDMVDMDFSTSGNIQMSSETSRTSSMLSQVIKMLEMYLPECANTSMVLDTGELVAATAGKYDKQIGRLAKKEKKGVAFA